MRAIWPCAMCRPFCGPRFARANWPPAWGGEEFGVILLTDPEKATLAAERMCRAVEAAPFEDEGRTRTITISIGLVHMDASDDERSALRRADAALYVAKHRRKNQVVVA